MCLGSVSLAGGIRTLSTFETDRWVCASKTRTDSISSSKSSIRTGASAPTGNMSMIPPRLLIAPG